MVEIASVITYIFLNIQSQVQYVEGAIVCYPILLFFLVGNMRVMLVYCRWAPWQVIFYKVVKVIGAIYFLVYGCVALMYFALCFPVSLYARHLERKLHAPG